MPDNYNEVYVSAATNTFKIHPRLNLLVLDYSPIVNQITDLMVQPYKILRRLHSI